MGITEAQLRESQAQDRRAVLIGTAVTALVTPVLFLAPDILPVEAFRRWYFDTFDVWMRGNPFSALRLLGGVIGGAVAGALTSRLSSGAVTGIKAAVYGLVIAYVLVFLFYVVYFPIATGIFPPPIVVAATIPFVFAIPMFGAHIVGGPIAGWVALRLRLAIQQRTRGNSPASGE